jgi:hypothetical protein
LSRRMAMRSSSSARENVLPLLIGLPPKTGPVEECHGFGHMPSSRKMAKRGDAA